MINLDDCGRLPYRSTLESQPQFGSKQIASKQVDITEADAEAVRRRIKTEGLTERAAAKQIGLPYISLRRLLHPPDPHRKKRRFSRDNWESIIAWLQGAKTPGNYFARQCALEIAFAHDLAEIIYEIKNLTGWDRLRLYVLTRPPRRDLVAEGLALQGTLELGGVQSDFRRFQLPVLTDVPTLELMGRGRGCLRYRRNDNGCDAAAEYASHGSHEFEPLRSGERRHVALDYSALNREGLRVWIDLVCAGENGESWSKLTCDCLYQDRQRANPVEMELPTGIWPLIDKLQERICDYRQRHYVPDWLTPAAPTVEDVCWEGVRYRVLEDHLKNLLVALISDPAFQGRFDDARLYLATPLWKEYFGNLAAAIGWIKPHHSREELRGFVEVGGTERPISEISLKSGEDPCTDIFLGPAPPAADKWARKLMRDGTPVVFSKLRNDPDAVIPRCGVKYFSNLDGLGRILPPNEQGERIELQEHLDLPILAAPGIRELCGPFAGKVTLDSKWHAGTRIPELDANQATLLRRYADRMGQAIAIVADWREHCEELYEALPMPPG